MNLLRACHRAMVLIALIEVFLVLVPDFVLSASSRLKKTAKKGKKDDQECEFKKHEKTNQWGLECRTKTSKKKGQCPCTRGRRGQKGARGRHGPAGPPGPPGQAGNDGRDGREGIRGLPGTTGVIGRPGVKGSNGPTGPPGPPGLAGRDGQPGPPGPPGPSGTCSNPSTTMSPSTYMIRTSCLPGAPGPRGEPGITGQTGPIGPTGPPGDRGDNGKSGGKGTKGDSGPPGSPGKIASLRCIVRFTQWFDETKWKSLTPQIGCEGSAFLQRFALQRTTPNMRYKYTCCHFE